MQRLLPLRACDIQWAHAVNSDNSLQIALNDESHFIEADITFDTNKNVAVMAHGVKDIKVDSITFEAWFTKLMEFNKSEVIKIKHAKLDFKDNQSAEACMKFLGLCLIKCNFQVWLNGDVVTGPFGNSQPTCNKFIDIFKTISNEFTALKTCTLSLGWTTSYVPFQSYNTKMISEMKVLVKKLFYFSI